ncbi:hypothetical protein ZWY2020_032662 [Hordeum vulgare]|nr:hypothetical protein ZWY2020_032662 [Hordeum vulgare]
MAHAARSGNNSAGEMVVRARRRGEHQQEDREQPLSAGTAGAILGVAKLGQGRAGGLVGMGTECTRGTASGSGGTGGSTTAPGWSRRSSLAGGVAEEGRSPVQGKSTVAGASPAAAGVQAGEARRSCRGRGGEDGGRVRQGGVGRWPEGSLDPAGSGSGERSAVAAG